MFKHKQPTAVNRVCFSSFINLLYVKSDHCIRQLIQRKTFKADFYAAEALLEETVGKIRGHRIDIVENMESRMPQKGFDDLKIYFLII